MHNSEAPSAPSPRAATIREATRTLLTALNLAPEGELAKTPERVAALWEHVLLEGQTQSLVGALGKGLASKAVGAVGFGPVAMHLVCPHHLTVALGRASLAYLPGGRVAGLGNLAAVVKAATARTVLQEDAGQAIAETLIEGLGAKAAWVDLTASHPCCALTYATAAAAETRSVAWAGDAEDIKTLMRVMPPKQSVDP